MLRPLPLLTLDVREGRAEGEGGGAEGGTPSISKQKQNHKKKFHRTAQHDRNKQVFVEHQEFPREIME